MKKILFTTLIVLCYIGCAVILISLIRADYLIYFKGMDKHAILDPMKPYIRALMATCWVPVFVHLTITCKRTFKK